MNLLALCGVILLLNVLSFSGLSCGGAWLRGVPVQQDASPSERPWTMSGQKPAGALPATCPGTGPGMSSGDRASNLPQPGKNGNRHSCACGQCCEERTVFDMNHSFRGGRFRDYRRLSRENLTDQVLRGAIYQLIQQNPGIDMLTIAEMAGANPHTVRYHITLLVSRSRVVSCRIQGKNRYYIDPGMIPPALSGSSIIDQNAPTARVILSCIAAEPGITRGEVALRASISGPSATRWLQRFAGAGLIVPVRDGRHVRYYPAGTGN